MKKYNKKTALIFLAAIIITQMIFLIFSGSYTAKSYQSNIYATTGIKFDGSDLSKLNEAAHYFGQTMIGWTKFPNFRSDLIKTASLPPETSINMYAQERQNFIFSIKTSAPIDFGKLKDVKNFLQAKMDEYNSKTNTQFVLTNVDYEQAEITKSYAFGALITLVLTCVAGMAVLFIRKEFFPPRLKL
jgi:hypothetical protein